jgi:hypothetical protein
MGMKDFHCETFELSFRFTWEETELDSFLKAVGIENREEAADEDGDILITNTFGRREKTTDYHGHIRVIIDKENKGRVTLRYHESALDIEDEEPPNVEDVANWLADFFKDEECKPRVTANYVFDSSYAPTITLPFPVAASEKALAGSSVLGVSIQLPEKHPLDMAVVQRGENVTLVTVLKFTSEIKLRDFNLLTELEHLETHLDSLVRKQEPSDETGSAQQEE